MLDSGEEKNTYLPWHKDVSHADAKEPYTDDPGVHSKKHHILKYQSKTLKSGQGFHKTSG